MRKINWTTTILNVRLIVLVIVFALCSIPSMGASVTKTGQTEEDIAEWKKDIPPVKVLFEAFLSYNDAKMEVLSKQLVRLS